jgi:hypothetical protein
MGHPLKNMQTARRSLPFAVCSALALAAACSALVLGALPLHAQTAAPKATLATAATARMPTNAATATATDSPAAAGKLIPVTPQTDAAWLAQARADYPLTSCAVSGDAFDGGAMGQPIDFIYREDGKPDRLVRMCCKDCQKDFRKDPAKYLKVIDDAAAAKAKSRT